MMVGAKFKENHALPQTFIIMLLVAALVLLHSFAQHREHGFDPTTMLAFGFVVLASYTIGGLLEYTKLPHITGYLIAGLVFGPSAAGLMSSFHLPAPFDKGVLNSTVISQLKELDTLAIALIALTAGGELKLDALRRGFKAIASIVGFQFLFVISFITVAVVSVSGVFDFVLMPQLADLSGGAVIALALMVAAIAFATSPAATIAVINETGAQGPMSKTVLSTVVLKDVVVVLTFAFAQVIAAGLMGTASMDQGFFSYLTQHILVSLIFGAAVGGGIAAYLRFINQELLLFLVGIVFTAAYVAGKYEWDMVLVFLVAGFVVSNFSKSGPPLIETVERLSLPVYVVFFTLAGAKLHLELLATVWPLALGLVAVRAMSIALGVRVGARFGGADDNIKSFGWLGFVSQAGVSISLAAILATEFGDAGKALETVIIGGVALNEIFGPILFKAGLGLAGEMEREDGRLSEGPGRISIKPPNVKDDGEKTRLKPWPEQVGPIDLWGTPLQTKSPELNGRVQELGADLQAVVRDVSTGPLREFRTEAEQYLRDLRREFLRHHRRLSVQARSDNEAQREKLSTMLRTAQAELAAHWRGIVLGRSITLTKGGWSPDKIVESVDSVVGALPEKIEVPYEDVSFHKVSGESVLQTLERAGLQLARKWREATGQPPPTRQVALRNLARFHVAGPVPVKLEGLAALFIEADRHMAARTRSIFDGIAAGYDDIVSKVSTGDVNVEAELSSLRNEVEEELALALDEVRRISRDGTNRAAASVAGGFTAMKADLPIYGTLDLPSHRRRHSKVFAQSKTALKTLVGDVAALRKASAAGYSLLAMELELLGLQARLKDDVEDYVSHLEDIVERRALTQALRVSESLEEALTEVEAALNTEQSGDELALSLRQVTEQAGRVTAEAAKVTAQLHEELSDESNIAPLLDALVDACRTLTPRYRTLAGQQQRGEWRLPTLMAEVDVDFREVVLTYVESRIAPKLLESTRRFAQDVQPLAALLQELERLIAFNVELATAELEVVHDEPVPEEMHGLLREMVSGQLERSLTTLREYESNAEQWPQELANQMRSIAPNELEELRNNLAEGTASRARLNAMRRASTAQRVLDAAEDMQKRAGWLRKRVKGLSQSLVGAERLGRWRRRFSAKGRVVDEEMSAEFFAAPTVSADLPLVYRRLFAADAMEAGDVLTGREDEIERAEKILSDDAQGRLRSVAIVGIDGVGKAAVAMAIVRTGRWKNVRRIVFDKPVAQDEVDAIFQEKPDNQLVIVDGLHWMLSMEPGGFEPLRRFVSGIIAEGGRRRWLTHADVLFWNFASTVAPLKDAFPEVVRLNALDPLELQAAVMARHRLSGYAHSFDRDAEAGGDGLIARGATRLRGGSFDQYFQELHQATGGLVRDALRLWLASIREIEGGEVVRLGAVPQAFFAKLNNLPDDVLVGLYQVARQGWLNIPGQSRLFRVDENTARAQLSRLAHVGLLTEKRGIFRIAVHLRGTLVRIFTDRGWVQ